MKITKILALLLALLMCLSFVACNDDTTQADSETETQAVSDTSADDKNGDDATDDGDGDELDLGGNLGEKLPDGRVIYFEDFQKYSNTTDNSALSTLGWKKMTVQEDKVMDESDVKFDFENGRLHVNTWNVGDAAVPGHSFYAIPQLNDEIMSTLTAGGYTLQYDIAFTHDIANANALSSIVINFSENNWTDAAVRASGTGLFENITAGKAYALGNSGIAATGNTAASSISGALLNEAPGATAPLLNLSVTVRLQVDPEKGPIFYVKKSTDPDTAFVKVGETVMGNGYVGWVAAASKAVALHNCGGLNAYYDNILVYSGLGECPVTIVPDNFSGSSTEQQAGNGTIYYFEDFDYASSFENNVMDVNTVNGISTQLMQDLGITCVNDGGLTTYMWIDDGRLMISNFSGFEGDTRTKDTNGVYSFFKIASLDDAVKMASLYNDKFTIQYDIAYGCKNVDGDSTNTLERDTASWAAMFDIILNMDGDDGVACGVAAGGYVRLDYLTTEASGTTNELLTDVSLMNRGQVLGNKLRESDVGAITVRIVVDPQTNTIKLYAKTAVMSDFVLAGTTSTLSDGYDSLVAATSQSIGFALQYGNNALLDNLIVYSGDENPPATDNQDNYYTAQ